MRSHCLTTIVQDNCGSVTPGVLRAFLPHLREITSFALGLSYSLTDDDVFAFCEDLPSLEILELRYYLVSRFSTYSHFALTLSGA